MGAFAGFGLGALAGSDWLRSQQQSGQQSSLIAQELQERLMDQQIKRLELLARIQKLLNPQKGVSEGTPQKIIEGDIEGLYFPSSGRETWLPKGVKFGGPPKPPTLRQLTAEEEGVAQSAGLPADQTQWGPREWTKFLTANAAYQRSKQPTPEALIYGTGAGGIPEVAGVEHPRTGGSPMVTPPVRLPFAPGKGATTGGASIKDINTGLDQMESMIPMLRTTPGVATGVIGEVGGRAKAFGGYPDEGAFMEAAGALADMIPKALAGRASQSSIDNALNKMVPAFHDTQESATRKIRNLRQLFVESGVIPPTSSAKPAKNWIPSADTFGIKK